MNSKNKTSSGISRTPAPLYKQVKDYILERVSKGQWPAGFRVPSENELVEVLNVSRMTANRAVRELTAEGVLERMQGVGTFVKERKPVATLLEIKPIAEEVAQRGGVHSSSVHLKEEAFCTNEQALAMNLRPKARIFHVVMVHMDDGVPIQLEDRYVNPVVAPDFMGQDFNRITPSRYLLDVAPLTEVEHVVEAHLPDEKTRKLLVMDAKEPCLVLNRRTWSNEQVATRSRFYHPATRFRLGGRFKPLSHGQPLDA